MLSGEIALKNNHYYYILSVVGKERLAMSINSSTTSKPTVTALMNMTSRAVSLMSVLSSKARLKAAHDFNPSFKVSLILSER